MKPKMGVAIENSKVTSSYNMKTIPKLMSFVNK